MDNQISQTEAFEKDLGSVPHLHAAQCARQGLRLFADLARERGQTVSRETVDLRILVPAFMISEIGVASRSAS